MEPGQTNDPPNGDSDEKLRIENEFLKLKLKAQFGEGFQIGGDSALPPEIENQFLKNVLAFEEAHQHIKYVKVYDLLGKPAFKKAGDLSDKQVSAELKRIERIMQKHNMVLDVLASYNDRTIYTFITEELFQHETETGEGEVPGMTSHFTYEEFHPNHRYDIDNRAQEFLNDWFGQKFSEFSLELANEFILPDRRIFKREQLLDKFHLVFDSYTSFENCKYHIGDTSFQFDDQNGPSTGLGNAEGAVKYDAILENGERIQFEGPFKLYMIYENEWWHIFYFVFPGFEWE